MKLNCAYRGTDGWCLKYSTFNVDVRCDGNPNCAGFAEDFGGDTNVPTNADHIRSMTDEELAKFLNDSISHGCVCPAKDCEATCVQCIVNWLKQPYKEEL